jgi:small subunit ribosomal protein S9
MASTYFEGVGRRKESSARVRVASGAGVFTVNEKSAEAYFTRYGDLQEILGPVQAANMNQSALDITIVVNGGGVTGQTDAAKLGLARALQKMDPETNPALRKAGYLTRDARIKERKKPGLKRARKAPTYTKR